MRRMKSAARFTLFSTLLMTAAISFFMLFIMVDITERAEIPLMISGTVSLVFISVPAGTALVSYLISSLVVDRVLNPVRDITAQVRAMGDRHYASRLVIDSEEDELREYAYVYNEMALKLNAYIDNQRRFVSDASHELSTPVTIINGHADMLLRWGKDEPDVLDESLAVIRREAVRMGSLIDDLLFLARGDNGKQPYHNQETDISALAAECVAEVRRLYPSRRFEMVAGGVAPSTTSSTDSYLYTRHCDAEAIRRVLRILLDNAVKYGGAGSVETCVSVTVDGRLRLFVADSGPGIPAAYLTRVFDRFFRADDARKKTEDAHTHADAAPARSSNGTGLGLSIAKEIIEHHSGTIHAENKPEGGALFIVELP